MNVGVVGAGAMGIGIAHAILTTKSTVVLIEPSDEAREKAVRRILEVLDRGVQRGTLAREEASGAKKFLAVSASLSDLPENLDLVVEAIPERVELKLETLAAIERRSPQFLASNTSSFSIDRLAANLKAPDRFLGMHFFNPVWAMSLVELVVGSATSPDTLKFARTCVAAIGKEAIVVRDSPGFATSRLGITLGLEAIRMVQDDIARPEDIDTGMVLGYGHPMGPLRLTDLVGLDVRLGVARHLAVELGERFRPPDLLERMVAEGKLGKKSGEGFYKW
jgi:3-hydroxybutyryl-CoA dehydrogenase